MREYHVRICERLGVKLPLSTRRGTLVRINKNNVRNKLLALVILMYVLSLNAAKNPLTIEKTGTNFLPHQSEFKI